MLARVVAPTPAGSLAIAYRRCAIVMGVAAWRAIPSARSLPPLGAGRGVHGCGGSIVASGVGLTSAEKRSKAEMPSAIA